MARRDDPDDRTRVALVDPWMGQVVAGRYRLELRIAAGGFGAIYRALDLAGDRDLALKLLHPSLTSDPAVVARFRREGAALQSLRDPHTVMAYDIGETRDGTLYIAMELLQGQSLYNRFREQGTMRWRPVAQIARAVCSSLAEAHALGIIHRDLKPANIHLEGEHHDFVKVLDFGIAKIVGGTDLTNAGHMIGTFDYMSPEQMVGGETTGKSDVFTLGVVMYELLVGERPFGDLPTAASMLAAMLSHTPVSPAARGVELPPDFDHAIMRCIAREPEHRPIVTELAAILDHVLAPAHDDDDKTRLEPITAKMDVAVPDSMITPVSDGDTVIDQPRPKFLPGTTLPGVAPPKKPR